MTPLAQYVLKTKALKQTVKRNLKRFPSDFMFELTKKEFDLLRPQIVTSKNRGGIRYMPFAFTEQVALYPRPWVLHRNGAFVHTFALLFCVICMGLTGDSPEIRLINSGTTPV